MSYRELLEIPYYYLEQRTETEELYYKEIEVYLKNPFGSSALTLVPVYILVD